MKRAALPLLALSLAWPLSAQADEIAPQVVLINQLKSCKSLQCPAAAQLIAMKDKVWPHMKVGLTAPDEMTRFWSLGVLSEVPLLKARDDIGGMLGDAKIRVRAAAAYALGAIKDKSVSPFLIKALQDKDLNVRFAAAVAMARVKDPATAPALAVAVRDRDEDVRAYACLALGDIGLKESVKILMERLDQDAHPKVRGFAAMALSKINDPSTFKLLRQRLKEETDAKALAAAIYALGELGNKKVLAQLQKLEASLASHPNKAIRESKDVAEYVRDAVDKLRATEFAKMKVAIALPDGFTVQAETATTATLVSAGSPVGKVTWHPKGKQAKVLAGAGAASVKFGGTDGFRSIAEKEGVKTARYFFDSERGVLEITFFVPSLAFDQKTFDRAAGSLTTR